MSESNRLQAKLDHIVALYEQAIELARQEEREACAKICDEQADSAYWEGADICADKIRARGEAK